MDIRIWEILIIAAGLSLDVFAYTLWKGAMLPRLEKGPITKIVLLFTGFQMGGLLLGNAIAAIPAFSGSLEEAGRLWTMAAAIIFFVTGGVMILKAVLKKKEKIIERAQDRYNYRMITLWAFITCLDAILAGISFGFLTATLLGTVLMTGVTTAAAALLGIFCGYRFGCSPKNTMVGIGGAIIIIGGVDVLLHYYGVL